MAELTKAAEAIDGRRLRRARQALLAWYDTAKRDLPWRKTRDPYAIWVSETMLQQTRVETVIPYYERFLERFPDVASLAEAELEDVYTLWTGLGYYSRARNLQHAAKSVVYEHAGQLPDDAETLRSLKGIGRYTAGALSSIAFDREEPVVDGNVVRVLARWLGVTDDVGQKAVVDTFWTVAGRLVAGPRPGDLNQALMELGATVCTPRGPRCSTCPLQQGCGARKTGDPERLPRKAKKKKPLRIEGVAAWIERRGRVLAVQRPEGGLLGGLWELPGGELEGDADAESGLHRLLESRLGLSVENAEPVGQIEHLFTHRRLRVQVFRCSEPIGRVRRRDLAAHRWLTPGGVAALPHGGPTRKALALLGAASAEPHRQRGRARDAAAQP
jgi:A/G-specific adenine glycosylase